MAAAAIGSPVMLVKTGFESLQILDQVLLERLNGLLVALVEGPLFNACPLYQASLRQDLQVLTRRRLTDFQFLSDGQSAHAILPQITTDLRRKQLDRSL